MMYNAMSRRKRCGVAGGGGIDMVMQSALHLHYYNTAVVAYIY
jgi:hypothetical protein